MGGPVYHNRDKLTYALSVEWRFFERHISTILSTVSAISYLIYIFVLFAIISRPALILSGVLTGFASISLLNGFISGISLIFMPRKIHTGFNFEAFTAIVLPLLSLFIYIFFLYKRTRLNIAQRSVVKIIHPKKLLFALESAVEDIKITIRALSIIDDHEGKEEFQLLNALAQEITRRYTVHRIHHKKRILYLIATTIWIVIAATIAAIWEGLSQAAFLDIVKQYICNIIGVCLK
jgi:hypothetical protein